MMMAQFEIQMEELPTQFGLSIWIILREGDRIYVAKPIALEFQEWSRGQRLDRPTLFIEDHYRMPFMEALKRAVEKVDIRAVEGELKATKYHLEDMRKLVFEGTPFRKKDEPIPIKLID
jgi:hypothetical protein